MSQETIQEIYKHFHKIQNLASISSLLYWDFETMMPKGAGALRSEQLSYLNTTAHQLNTDKSYVDKVMGVDVAKLNSKADQSHIAKLQKNLGKSLCVDEDFVQRDTEVSLKCHEQWKAAREANSFGVVKNNLRELVKLKQEYAARVKAFDPLKKYYAGKTSYEIFLDEFEPGISSDYLRTTLKTLVDETITLLPEIEAKQQSAAPTPIKLDVDSQHKIVLYIAENLGFDFSHGRIDKSVHPFCGGHPLDTRMTTKYLEDDVTYAGWSTIHETGHGLYEQGLPKDLINLPCGTAASMGVHESQSRFYENQIGRSMAFCQWIAPKFGVDAKTLHATLNHVERSFIRTESDEVTYNLHIYLRMQIEEKLIEGTLDVNDLEDAWNEAFKKAFALSPPSPLKGVLQDTHWYGGALGYFPTYSLGNLLAAELFEIYSIENPNWQDLVAKGSFGHIKEFMKGRVHKLAALNDSPTTMKQILGGRLPEAKTLIKYFRKKYL